MCYYSGTLPLITGSLPIHLSLLRNLLCNGDQVKGASLRFARFSRFFRSSYNEYFMQARYTPPPEVPTSQSQNNHSQVPPSAYRPTGGSQFDLTSSQNGRVQRPQSFTGELRTTFASVGTPSLCFTETNMKPQSK